jgi:hypothetical protein
MKLLDLAVRIAFGSFLCGLVVAEAQAEQVARVKFPIDPLHLNDVGAGTPSDPLQGIMSAISKPFQDLANFISSDAAGAAALATVVPGLQDTNGQACWLKMQDAGAVFKAHPVPVTLKIMTDFEAIRLLNMTANNLCSYAPCTVVFADAANLVTSVSSAVGGVTTSGIQIPSLTTLCARIPQISPMLPDAATGLSKMTVTPVVAPAAVPAVPEVPH